MVATVIKPLWREPLPAWRPFQLRHGDYEENRNLHLYSALIINLEGKCVKKIYKSYKKDSVVERESNIVNTPNCQTANLPLSDCCLRASVCACESDLGD